MLAQPVRSGGQCGETLELALMAIRSVLRMGDPRLRRIASAVPPEAIGSQDFTELIDDLRDTMAAMEGAGLAAPQIGVPWRVVIFGVSKSTRYPEAPPIPETVLINPVIKPLGHERCHGWEGCLSVPGLRGSVSRWQRVQYRGLDAEGQQIAREVEGFHARVVQHECDHLDGVLFPDRLDDPRMFGFSDELEAAGLLTLGRA